MNKIFCSGSSPAHLQVPPLFRLPRCHFPLSCHSDRSPGIQSFDCHFQELSLSFAISFLQAHSLSVSEWGEVQLGADLATALLTPTYLKQVRLQNILSHLPHQADTYVSTYIPPIHSHPPTSNRCFWYSEYSHTCSRLLNLFFQILNPLLLLYVEFWYT